MLSAVSFPSKYTSAYLDKFDMLLKNVIEACGIKEGPVTLQCFIGEKGIKISELLFRLAGGSPYLYATYLGGPNTAKMLIQYDINEPIDYQNLEVFRPFGEEAVYFDVQIFIKEKGNIYYNFEKDVILQEIEECVDLRLYHQSGNPFLNVSDTGKIFARAICRLKSRDNQAYYELIESLEEKVIVFNEYGERISFIRKPEHLEMERYTDIDWNFMDGK